MKMAQRLKKVTIENNFPGASPQFVFPLGMLCICLGGSH